MAGLGNESSATAIHEMPLPLRSRGYLALVLAVVCSPVQFAAALTLCQKISLSPTIVRQGMDPRGRDQRSSGFLNHRT